MKTQRVLRVKSLLLISTAAMSAACSYSPQPSYLYTPAQAVYYYPPGPTELPPQQNYQAPPQRPIEPKEMAPDNKYTAAQLDQILGPVALYPDPLLIQLLTAATQPNQITDLNEFLKKNPSPTDEQIAAQTWDPSVKGLAKVPSVVTMMAGKMDWTQALGWAMVNQQPDVMDSVQRLRAQARNNKALETTPQQQVVEAGGAIQIIPVQPDVIYVPYYDPYAVYGYPYPYDPWAWGYGFGFGITFGSACYIDHHYDHSCDWRSRTIYQGRSWGNWNGVAAGTPLKRWTPSASANVSAPATAFVPPRPVDEFHRVSRVSGRAPVSSGASSGSAAATPSRSVFTGPTSPARPAMPAIPSAVSSSPGGDHHRDRGSGAMAAPAMPSSIPQSVSPPVIQSFSGPSPAPSISPSGPWKISPNVSSSPPQRMVIPASPTPIPSSPSSGSSYHRDRGGSSRSFSLPPSSVQSSSPRSSPAPAASPAPSAPPRSSPPAPSPAPSSSGSSGHTHRR
jgi:hypothetical protein